MENKPNQTAQDTILETKIAYIEAIRIASNLDITYAEILERIPEDINIGSFRTQLSSKEISLKRLKKAHSALIEIVEERYPAGKNTENNVFLQSIADTIREYVTKRLKHKDKFPIIE